MGRACSVCQSKNRDAIDAALLEGGSCRGIARRFAVSPDAVERHRKAHLSRSLVRTKITDGEAVAAELAELKRKAEAIFDRAERADQLSTALRAIGEARAIFETVAKVKALAGDMMSRQEADVLRDQIIDIVMRHIPEPNRKAAIAADLQALRVRAFSREVPS